MIPMTLMPMHSLALYILFVGFSVSRGLPPFFWVVSAMMATAAVAGLSEEPRVQDYHVETGRGEQDYGGGALGWGKRAHSPSWGEDPFLGHPVRIVYRAVPYISLGSCLDRRGSLRAAHIRY
jgi:hypothetical protein